MGRNYIDPLPDNPAYYLGALCKNSHAYKDTNQTLRRRSDRECPVCNKLRNRAWEKANPMRLGGSRKTRDLRRKFGMDIQEYEQMLREQEGLCALCGSPPRERRLAVDHCHTTDNVRALLCRNCNIGLGLFMDNPALLRAAADYLESYASD